MREPHPSASTNAARALVGRTLLWENHCCMPFENADTWLPQLERYRGAGFGVVHVNIGDADVPLERMVRTLASFRAWIARHADRFVIASSVGGISRARAEGKLSICFDIEGAHAIGRDLDLIAMFYELGVRWMLMAYNRGNLAAAGCHDAQDAGLTALGRRLIAEMDRVGMIKDVAHTGYRSAMDVCVGSAVPVTISHSNPRALTDHPRCVPDDLMKACAATGGVLGISGVGLFLGNNDISTPNVVRSIDYSVELMGIDHVGIGLDYVFGTEDCSDGYAANPFMWPPGFGYSPDIRFMPPEQIADIAEALLLRGYRDAEVEKILGGNFLRVAQQVWK